MIAFFPKDGTPGFAGRRSGGRRPQRVADTIHNEIAHLLVTKVKDPRLKRLTITAVTVSPDLRRATVYYSVYGNGQEVQAAEAGLKKAAGFFRSHLARTLDLRMTPELSFRHDPTVAQQEKLERIFKELDNDGEEDR